MFKYKTNKELAAMSEEDVEKYTTEKRAYENEQMEAAIKAATKGLAKGEDITEAVKSALKDPLQKMADLEKMVGEQKEEVAILKEQGSAGKSGVPLSKQIADSREKLKSISKRTSSDEVVVKADTVRASIATNNNQLQIGGIGQLQRIKRSLYDLFRKITISKGNHNGTIAYIDWDETTVKAAAMVAEGGTFPESEAKFKGYTLSLQKVGDTLPVSEEFFEDEEAAAGELELFLTRNVDSKVDYEIVNGDNTGSHLKGLLASMPAYTAVAAGISDANIYDLITKVKSNISSSGSAKYQTDFAAMNQNSADLLLLHKDHNDNYQFPPNHPIWAMIIIDDNIADDVMIVGDSRFAAIYEMGGVVISQGEVNAQFTADMKTIKARKRLAFLIREADKTGFRKVASIAASLATIGS